MGDEVATDINGGKVVFKVNGKTLKDANGKVIYAKVINGTATITDYEVPSSWAKDNITIQAVYSGSSQCEALRTSANLTVTKDTPSITSSDVTASKGETVTLTATVSDGNAPVNVGKVVFKVNGKTVKDANGKVVYAKVVNGTVSVEYTIPENMKAGSYNITVSFTAPGYDKLVDTKTLTVSA
jgi:sensor domain CHASE-containing protein